MGYAKLCIFLIFYMKGKVALGCQGFSVKIMDFVEVCDKSIVWQLFQKGTENSMQLKTGCSCCLFVWMETCVQQHDKYGPFSEYQLQPETAETWTPVTAGDCQNN